MKKKIFGVIIKAVVYAITSLAAALGYQAI